MSMQNIKHRTKLDVALRSREEHAYSPSIQKLIDLSISFVPYVEEVNRNGGQVVWYEGGSWYPLINGCGVIPALFVEIFRYDGKSGIDYAEEHFQIPNETCSMAKSAIGQFYMNRDTTIKRVVGSSIGCEPLLQGFQFLKKFGYDMFLIDGGFIPPKERRFEVYKDFTREECKRLVHWLTGGEADREKLRFEQIRFNRIQDKIRLILELRKKHCMYMKSVPTVLMYCGNGHYFGRAEEYEAALDGIIADLESLPEGAYNDAVARLAWAGQRGSLSIMDAVDHANAALTEWYTAGSYSNNVRTDIDPLEAAVEYTVGDRYYAGKSEDKCKVIGDAMREGGEKGILLYTMMGCSFGTIEQELERLYFQKRGIATLSIADTYDEGQVSGQLDTRIKAFVEMLS